MNAFLEKFVENILISMPLVINTNMGFGGILGKGRTYMAGAFSVVGFQYPGLRFLRRILSECKGQLAYCQVRAKGEGLLLPLIIDGQGAKTNG